VTASSPTPSQAGDLTGYGIVDEPPALRHFSARFEQLATT
jgi:tryptophanase